MFAFHAWAREHGFADARYVFNTCDTVAWQLRERSARSHMQQHLHEKDMASRVCVRLCVFLCVCVYVIVWKSAFSQVHHIWFPICVSCIALHLVRFCLVRNRNPGILMRMNT